MKKFGKFLKWFLIIIVGFVAVLYLATFVGHKVLFKPAATTTPTAKAVGTGDFKFGVQTQKQAKTSAEYVKVLAKQVKNYNQRISTYWPNNPETNQYVITQDIDTNKVWMISPNGEVKTIPTKDLKKYHIETTIKTNGQWSPFKGNGISGAFLTIAPESLNNYYQFQKYYYLGTYDTFITYSHELFHSVTQDRWAKSTLGNKDSYERPDDTLGRRYRMQLMQQLAKAISSTNDSDREAYTKAALATYKAYQKNNKADYKATMYWDRMEGTAYYYELKTSLYAAYPTKINSDSDVYKAVGVILKNDNVAYRDTGAVAEGYNIGGYASFLLDMLAVKNGQNVDDWKNQIETEGNTTPLTLLEKQYEGQTLPKAEKIPSKAELTKWMAAKDKISPESTGAQNIFGLLYSMLYGKE